MSSVAKLQHWCGSGDLNYSITLITRNLFVLQFGVKAQMPTIPLPCTLLYGERTAEEKTAPQCFLSILPATV